MKKIITLVLILIFVFTLVGCQKPNSHLVHDDFDIYSNGIVVIEKTNFPEFFVDYSDNYDATMLMRDRELIEKEFVFSDLPVDTLLGKILETKRGVSIGDTLDDVVEKYNNTECLVELDSADRVYLLIEELNRKHWRKKIGTTYTLRMTSCYIHGGYWDRKKLASSINTWTFYGYEEYPYFVGAHRVYSLFFFLENDVITDIVIKHW